MNRINIFEINNNYNGETQQNLIILKDNINQIREFINDLIYVFEQKSIIQLIIKIKIIIRYIIMKSKMKKINMDLLIRITINNNKNDNIKGNDEDLFFF